MLDRILEIPFERLLPWNYGGRFLFQFRTFWCWKWFQGGQRAMEEQAERNKARRNEP